MRSSHPPIMATWLLEHLRSDKQNESLIGDLVEDYGRGRSNAWYWRQVLAAIVVSSCDEVRAHVFIAIKAMVTGWAAQFMLQFGTWALLNRFHLWLPLYHKLPLFFGYGIAASVTWLILWTPIWMGSGWFVGGLYRSHLAGMVLVFSASVLVWKLLRLPWTIHLLFDAAGDSRYLPQLAVELMNLILPSVYIVLGGLLAGISKRDSSAQDVQIVA
jgi:hypothetical protein